MNFAYKKKYSNIPYSCDQASLLYSSSTGIEAMEFTALREIVAAVE